MALTDQLTAIGNAIRTKTGGTALIDLDDMPTAILNIPSGGGDIPSSALTITGDCKYRFYNGGWDWFIQSYGNRVTTTQISNVDSMFYGETLAIPFDINLASSMSGKCSIFYYYYGTTTTPQVNISASQLDLTGMFDSCRYITQVGNVTYPSGFKPMATSKMFNSCTLITALPSWLDGMDYSYLHNSSAASAASMFKDCGRLRTISSTLLPKLYTSTTAYSSSIYNQMFGQCCSLDEVDGLAVEPATITSNHFRDTFYDCHHLKRVRFTMNNGSVYTANWKNQTIDLSERNGGSSYQGVGFFGGSTTLFPQEKRVTDATSYDALKNDPDWWTSDKAFSRYNHDSAVETINSLPDTSNYGTNIIKFAGSAGADTDGGAINTLTTAEIAVATSKGWTVTLV